MSEIYCQICEEIPAEIQITILDSDETFYSCIQCVTLVLKDAMSIIEVNKIFDEAIKN